MDDADSAPGGWEPATLIPEAPTLCQTSRRFVVPPVGALAESDLDHTAVARITAGQDPLADIPAGWREIGDESLQVRADH
jgi:hypothetical protein